MRASSILVSIALLLTVPTVAICQQPKQEVYVAPNAPKDKPIDAANSEVQRIEEAIKPYIAKARSTFPEAKARFLTGLPPKHTFFITTRLFDSSRRYEQVFIAVREIKDGKVTGVIASQIRLVSGFSEGDAYTFPETDLIDWTISKPDGTEEGNFVGNFLDTYQPAPTSEENVWRNSPATPARMNQRIEEAAVKYAANAPISRIVLYDIGYPQNNQEYKSLDGNALILLTAISQEREELPLQRVYVVLDGKEIELKSLKLVLSEQSEVNNATAKTFGRYRSDALYLVPMFLRLKAADVLVDFRKNKLAFKIATFGTPLSDEVNKLSIEPPTGVGPSQIALQEFIKREYPSFFQ